MSTAESHDYDSIHILNELTHLQWNQGQEGKDVAQVVLVNQKAQEVLNFLQGKGIDVKITEQGKEVRLTIPRAEMSRIMEFGKMPDAEKGLDVTALVQVARGEVDKVNTEGKQNPHENACQVIDIINFYQNPGTLPDPADMTKIIELLHAGVDFSQIDNNPIHSLFRSTIVGDFAEANKILVALAKTNVNLNAIDNDLRMTPLHLAVEGAYAEAIAAFIENGADVTQVNALEQTPLHLAVQKGDGDTVKAFFREGVDINIRDSEGKTALLMALEESKGDIFQILLDAGAKVDQGDNNGETPLHRAVRMENMEALQALLAKGANVNAASSSGETALHIADTKLLFVKALLQAGADVRAVTVKGETALHLASHIECARALLAKGADINAISKEGNTPLHEAILWGKFPDLIGELIKAGANPTIKNKEGVTPLDLAPPAMKKWINDLAARRGASPRMHQLAIAQEDLKIMSATAQRRENAAEVIKLIDKYCDPKNEDFPDQGDMVRIASLFHAGVDFSQIAENPIHMILKSNILLDSTSANKIILLALAHVDINAKDAYGMTPLHVSVDIGNSQLIALFIAQGADTRALNNKDQTPLHRAVQRGSEAAVQAFIDSGADLNVGNSKGMTSLHIAAQEKKNLQLLLDAGADVNLADSKGVTALHYAAAMGDVENVRALLAKEANPNTADSYGCTPLHDAVTRGSSEIVRLLLANKTNPDSADANGFTPLHEAVSQGSREMIRELILAGADLTIQNDEGLLPDDMTSDLELKLFISKTRAEALQTELQRRAAQKATQPSATHEKERLKRAQLAMEEGNKLSPQQKIKLLDDMIKEVETRANSYGAENVANIRKTLEAAKNLITNERVWDAYAQRIQNSSTTPPTDTLTAKEINETIYGGFKDHKPPGLGIICHAEDNNEASVLRSFAGTFVSGLMAAKELGLVEEFLKHSVSGSDICLEARAKSANAWIANNLLSSISINVDPQTADYTKALGGYVEAFKETQLRQFYYDVYKNDYEGAAVAGYGIKMEFNTDTWKAYKLQMEADPRFYQQYFKMDEFKKFFAKELPTGVNLEKEKGTKYAKLDSTNLEQAMIDAKNEYDIDNPFNADEALSSLKALRRQASKEPDNLAQFADEAVAQDVAVELGYSFFRQADHSYKLFLPDKSYYDIEVMMGGAIKVKGEGGLSYYYPSMKDFLPNQIKAIQKSTTNNLDYLSEPDKEAAENAARERGFSFYRESDNTYSLYLYDKEKNETVSQEFEVIMGGAVRFRGPGNVYEYRLNLNAFLPEQVKEVQAQHEKELGDLAPFGLNIDESTALSIAAHQGFAVYRESDHVYDLILYDKVQDTFKTLLFEVITGGAVRANEGGSEIKYYPSIKDFFKKHNLQNASP